MLLLIHIRNLFICIIYLFILFQMLTWNHNRFIKKDSFYTKTLCKLILVNTSNCLKNNINYKKNISSNEINDKIDINMEKKQKYSFYKNIKIIVKYNTSFIQYRYGYIFVDSIYDKKEFDKFILRYYVNKKNDGIFSCYYDNNEPEIVMEKIPQLNIFLSFLLFLFNVSYILLGFLLFYFIFWRKKYFSRKFSSKDYDKLFDI